MNDEQLVALIRETDAHGEGKPLPKSLEDRSAVLLKIDWHSRTSSTTEEIEGSSSDRRFEISRPRSQPRGSWVATAAAVITAVVVGSALWLGRTQSDPGEPAAPPPAAFSSDRVSSPSLVDPSFLPELAGYSASSFDAFEREPLVVDGSGSAATGGSPLPDVEGAVAGDDGSGPLPLGVVAGPPVGERLDFLFEFCAWPGVEGCFRDAHFMDPDDPLVGSGPWTAGRAFHVRHGFVNEGDEPLGDGFDVVLYVIPMDAPGEFGGVTTGDTVRYTSDYVLRGTTDQCGPTYKSQSGPVTCEWFVHEFPDGLPEGRHALWAVWEAPCGAWLEYGFTDACSDPDEVMSLFSSGVDSPFGDFPPSYTEVNEAHLTQDL